MKIVYGEENTVIFCAGLTSDQSSQGRIKTQKPTKEGPLSFLLFESPFTTVGRGRPFSGLSERIFLSILLLHKGHVPAVWPIGAAVGEDGLTAAKARQKPKEPTKDGSLSFVLFESPFTSVSTDSRSQPYLWAFSFLSILLLHKGHVPAVWPIGAAVGEDGLAGGGGQVKAGHGALGTRLTQQVATRKNQQVIYQKYKYFDILLSQNAGIGPKLARKEKNSRIYFVIFTWFS
jgi:hypothetical protein